MADPLWVVSLTEWCGILFCLASSLACIWLFAMIVRQPRRKRLLLQQLAHLSFAAFLDSTFHGILWTMGVVKWKSLEKKSANSLCQITFGSWRFSMYWSCMLYVHIVIGMLLSSRHSISLVENFSKTLWVLPIFAVMFLVPSAVSPQFAISEGGVVNYCGSQDPEQHLFSVALTFLFGLSICGFIAVQIKASASTGAVVTRVYENSKLFMLVYFASWFLLVIAQLPHGYGLFYFDSFDQVMASLRGLFEALAYAHLVQRRQTSRDRRRVHSFNVAFGQNETLDVSRLEISGREQFEEAPLSDEHARLLEQFTF